MDIKLPLDRPAPVRGKRILVTGGSSGYGRAAVLRLLADGAKVATCARGVQGLRGVRQAGALALAADVGSETSVKALLERVRSAFGGLDAVVNNAAILPRGGLLDLSPADWRRVVDINLAGPWLVTRASLPLMQDGGSILNVTSGLGWFPMPPYNAYAVTKAGLNMLTRAMAQELGPRFRVNALDPGVARTRMNPTAELSPDAAVPAIRFLAAVGPEGPTGCCWRKNGAIVPWRAEDALERV